MSRFNNSIRARWVCGGGPGRLTLAWIVLGLSFVCCAQQDQSNGIRKVVTRVVPEYPQLARNSKLGGIVKMEAPLAMCKVMLVDPKTNKPSRIRIKTLPNGDKVRVAKSGETIA